MAARKGSQANSGDAGKKETPVTPVVDASAKVAASAALATVEAGGIPDPEDALLGALDMRNDEPVVVEQPVAPTPAPAPAPDETSTPLEDNASDEPVDEVDEGDEGEPVDEGGEDDDDEDDERDWIVPTVEDAPRIAQSLLGMDADVIHAVLLEVAARDRIALLRAVNETMEPGERPLAGVPEVDVEIVNPNGGAALVSGTVELTDEPFTVRFDSAGRATVKGSVAHHLVAAGSAKYADGRDTEDSSGRGN